MDKKSVGIAAVTIVLMFSALLFAFLNQQKSRKNEPASDTFFSMDTVMTLSGYCSDDVIKETEALVKDLEAKFSTTSPDSEIYKINHDKTAIVSSDTFNAISLSLGYCAKTNGALDISIYPIVSEWGFTTGDYRVPTAAALKSLSTSTDYRKIVTCAETGSVTLPSDMQIDLGSIAKGYTADRITEFLRSRDVTSALLNLGGNVQAIGSKPDGTPWRIGIADPYDSSKNIGYVDVTDKAVVTSGGYERYFEQNGKIYIHIIDPKTGFPVDYDLVSVTIIGDLGVLSDAYSTALFVMGLEQASEFWKGSNDFEAIFVTHDNKMYITEGLSGTFVSLRDEEPEVISR